MAYLLPQYSNRAENTSISMRKCANHAPPRASKHCIIIVDDPRSNKTLVMVTVKRPNQLSSLVNSSNKQLRYDQAVQQGVSTSRVNSIQGLVQFKRYFNSSVNSIVKEVSSNCFLKHCH